MTNDGYVKSLYAHVIVLKTYSGAVAQHIVLVTKTLKLKGLSNPTNEEKVSAGLEVRNEYLA